MATTVCTAMCHRSQPLSWEPAAFMVASPSHSPVAPGPCQAVNEGTVRGARPRFSCLWAMDVQRHPPPCPRAPPPSRALN
jgi:hypothetical protein